jgi:hypothetical protein
MNDPSPDYFYLYYSNFLAFVIKMPNLDKPLRVGMYHKN